MSKKNGLQLDDDLERQIEGLARSKGLTPAELVREAVAYLASARNGNQQQSSPGSGSDETLFDRWSQLGFIGCVDDPDLPSDLSTNRAHFEGFGRD